MILVNTNEVAASPPSSIRDLTDPRWKHRVAIANPLFGTTTMHTAALFAALGPAPLDDAALRAMSIDESLGETLDELHRRIPPEAVNPP